MSHGLKLLLIAAGAIITCVVVVVGFQLTKSGKNDTNKAVEEYSSMMSGYDEIKLTIYEDTEVSGADVITFIRDHADVLVKQQITTVSVKTKSSGTQSYNASDYLNMSVGDVKDKLMENQAKKTEASYINPTGSFLCSITRNDNGMITTIEFEQK